ISNDMRDLLASSEPGARLAVDYFVYRAAREIGGLAAVLGGVDALVFCAGVGERAAGVRPRGSPGARAPPPRRPPPGAPAARRAADHARAEPHLGMGDPDQRRAHDRTPHERAARPRRGPRMTHRSREE